MTRHSEANTENKSDLASGIGALGRSLTAPTPDYLVTKNCGVCLASNSLKIHSTFPSEVENETVLYVCSRCTAIYNSTSETNKLENDVEQSEWFEEQDCYTFPAEVEEFEALVVASSAIFQWFSEHFDFEFSGKSFCEIGAGTGAASIAASRYFDECTSTDITLSRLHKAKDLSNTRNLTIIEREDADRLKFDFFFAWHVFEHLMNPGQVFIDAFGQLNPGGVMFLQMPLMTERHIFPAHIFMHNQYSWTRVLSKLPVKEKHFFYDTALCAMTLVVVKKDAA